MTGTIGIIGCSAPGAALCFEAICRDAQLQLGLHVHPEVSLHILPFADHVACVRAQDWEGLARMLLTSVERLRAAGAQFVICPDNTAHLAFDRAAPRASLPWIHIADGVADAAAALGARRVGLLGTQALLASDLYDVRLRARGVDTVRPPASSAASLDALIFGELSSGVVSPAGRRLLAELTASLRRDQGCDAVVLGCTELPLLLDPAAPLALPALDSTRLLAAAAIARSIELGRPAAAVRRVQGAP